MNKNYVLSFQVTGDGKVAVNAFKQVGDESDKARQKVKGFGDETDKAGTRGGKSILGMATSLRSVAAVAGTLVVARYLQQTADNATLAEARIRLVTRSLQEQKRVSDELFNIAQRLQLPYQEVVNSYPRMARAIQEVGGSTRDALDVTRIFAQTVKISGANQAEAAASALQFAQALSSGRLQGDELRSVLENNSRLAKALADGMGVTVGELRKLGEQGELTTGKVTKALLSQMAVLETEAASVPKTIAGGWTALTNEMQKNIETAGLVRTSHSAIANALASVAEGLKRGREEMEKYEVLQKRIGQAPDSVRAGGTKAIAQWRAEQERSQGLNPGAAGASNAATLRGMENQFDEQRAAAAANALKIFNEAVREAGGQAVIIEKYEIEIRKLAQSFAELSPDAQASAANVKSYQDAFAEIMRQRADALSKLGKTAPSAYQKATHSARDFVEQLKLEATETENTTQQTIMLAAATKSLSIDNMKSRETFMAQVLALSEATAAYLDAQVAKKKLQEDTKRLNEAMGAELQSIADAVEQQKQKNIELEFGRQALLDYLIAQEEARLAAVNFGDATETEVAAIQSKINKLRELKKLEGRGEQIEKTKDAAKDAAREAERAFESRQDFISDILAYAIGEGGRNGAALLEKIINGVVLKPGIDFASNALSTALWGAPGGGGGGAGGGMIGSLLGNIGSSALGASVFGSTLAYQGIGVGASQAAMLAAQTGSFGAAGLSATSSAAASASGANSIAGFAFDPVTAAIAIAVAIIASGAFDDGPENQKGQLGFNTSNRTSRNPFGSIGVVQGQGTAFTEGVEQFFGQLSALDQRLARQLDEGGMARVLDRLGVYDRRASGTDRGASTEFAFPEGDSTAQAQLRLEGLIEKYGDIFEEISPKWAEMIRAFKGTDQELLKLIGDFVSLLDATTAVDDAIAGITGNTLEQFRRQLTALDTAIESAQSAFDTAVEGSDPAEILSAQQNLMQAVLNRYNTERQLLEQIGDQIEGLKQQAYDFALSIAQRINAAGGSRDIAALAGGRASSIRSGYGAITDPGRRVNAIQGYLGAIDTWYEERKAAIERDAANQAAMMESQSQAQAAIAQARASALQTELDQAQQWVGILGQARGQLDAMRFTAASPISALGRLSLATGDVNARMADFRGMTGAGKVDAATKLLPLLQTRLGLLQEGFQRPSDEYGAGYNEIVAMLSEVEAFAQTQEEKALSLSQRIAEAQDMANSYAAQSYDASLASNALLEELNAQYIEQLEWAEAEGAAAYEQAERLAREQRDAITGGMEVDLYLASLQRDSRDLLEQIRDAILAQTTGTAAGGGTTGAGGSTGGGAGAGGGSGGGGDVIIGDIIITPSGGRLTDQDIINAVVKAAPYLKRELAKV